MGTRLYLTRTFRVSVPCQSFGPSPLANATVLTPLELLTVIRGSLACFRASGQEVNATYHGCALPTELRWLLYFVFGNS
jgi:hypothetical protein